VFLASKNTVSDDYLKNDSLESQAICVKSSHNKPKIINIEHGFQKPVFDESEMVWAEFN
jgi:hypothetical protein